MGLGHLGVPWGWVSWGFGAGAAALAWMGYGDSWMLFLWRRHAALLGMPVPADVGCQPGGRTVPGWSGGGVWGSGGALPPGWGYGWAWGLGSWLVCRREHGLVHALGPALVWGSSMHRCLRRGGGPIEAGVNGLYLGVLLSYVSLGTDWMMGWGSFFLCCGSGGPPQAAMGPGLDGLGPPPWADLG